MILDRRLHKPEGQPEIRFQPKAPIPGGKTSYGTGATAKITALQTAWETMTGAKCCQRQ